MEKINMGASAMDDCFMTRNGSTGWLMSTPGMDDKAYILGMSVREEGTTRFRLGIYDKGGKNLRDGNEGFDLLKKIEDNEQGPVAP